LSYRPVQGHSIADKRLFSTSKPAAGARRERRVAACSHASCACGVPRVAASSHPTWQSLSREKCLGHPDAPARFLYAFLADTGRQRPGVAGRFVAAAGLGCARARRFGCRLADARQETQRHGQR